jgi:hypothetical protein
MISLATAIHLCNENRYKEAFCNKSVTKTCKGVLHMDNQTTWHCTCLCLIDWDYFIYFGPIAELFFYLNK